MKLHLSMPHDGQSNVYMYNGLRMFARQHGLDLRVTFTDHRNQSAERVVEYINKVHPDVCLFLYLNDLHSFIDYIKVPNKAGWIFDVTFGGEEIPKSPLRPVIDKLDYFFSICPEHAKECDGFWVPEGYDPCSHFPIWGHEQHEITFVGQVVENSESYRKAKFVHLDREKWLTEIAKSFNKDLEIFGPTFGDVLVSEFHTNRVLKGSWENNIISTNSKINLGHSGWPDVKYSWSARDYRIMAAKGFLITNKIKGHDDFFRDGKNIVFYESDEECVDKIRYYTKRPDLREAITQKAVEKVQTTFTFCHSFEKMFTHMGII